MSMIKRKCPICSTEYMADEKRFKHGKGLGCSKSCSTKISSLEKGITKKHNCGVCDKVVYRTKSVDTNKHGSVFCSPECHYKGRSTGLSKRVVETKYKPRVIMTTPYYKGNCRVCDKRIVLKKKTTKYCSPECFHKDMKIRMRGKNNPAYKNGMTYEKRGYRGDGWDETREAVFKRDNYTCQRCNVVCIRRNEIKNSEGANLIQCHHKEEYNGNNNEMENLETLCAKCHFVVHN